MRGVLCSDCAGLINLDDDLFCMVTPHGERYGYAAMIPLCRQCRAEQGYDILGNYTVVSSTQRQIQSQLPRLEYKHNPENDNDTNTITAVSSDYSAFDSNTYLEEIVESEINSQVETS